ncbi:PSP1 domain-containing protein [Propionibacterium freudenreichii]|uniref:PSP1 domain-containing protein n=1 Tax=Propionibacterium freudenreichii TaxID=1744 RepID=UPI003851DF4E
MASVLAVEFQPHGQLHYLAAGGHEHAIGDQVLYPTEDGREVARVVWRGDVDLPDAVPVCAGAATPADLARDEANRQVRADAAEVARLLIERHGLAMKLLAVDFLDQSSDYDRLTVFYYQSPERVDFRALLGDLVRALRSRIDLRQVGARDAARLTGGVGPCGRPLCCSSMLTLDPVSLRLAREQGMLVSAVQRCGVCGHAMCCLRYEQQAYEDFHARAPKVGTTVMTPAGEGTVIGHQVPNDALLVRTRDGEQSSCPLAQASACQCAAATPRKKKKPRTKRRRADAAVPNVPGAAGAAPLVDGTGAGKTSGTGGPTGSADASGSGGPAGSDDGAGPSRPTAASDAGTAQ